MDLQQILAFNIMVVSALALGGALLQGAWRGNLLWLAVNALVVVAGAVLLNWAPGSAGTVVTLLFVPLVLGPVVLARMTQSRVQQQRMREATTFARLASWLHPTRRTRLNAAMIEAQSADTLEGQLAALSGLAQRADPPERVLIEATRLRLQGKWDALLELLGQHPEVGRMLAGLQVRALGETGQLDRMTRAYEDAKSGLHGAELATAQLVMLALAGRPGDVARLLQGPLASLDGESRDFWLAIAERAAGISDGRWQQVFERLSATARAPSVRTAAARALAAGGGAMQPARLDEISEVIVEECAQRLRRNEAPQRRVGRFAPVTWLLLAGIVAGYVMSEQRGGSENIRTLVNLGALWPPYVTERGEWWRLAAALFLHWGPLHAGINGVMLIVLGRAAEQAFGSFRMALIYVLGGLASTAFVLWLAVARLSEPAVLVGASGAIMALFGGLAGRHLVTWLRHRDVLDGRNLLTFALVIALQVAVDLAMPQVSLAAHASGLVAGLVIGALLTMIAREQAAASV